MWKLIDKTLTNDVMKELHLIQRTDVKEKKPRRPAPPQKTRTVTTIPASNHLVPGLRLAEHAAAARLAAQMPGSLLEQLSFADFQQSLHRLYRTMVDRLEACLEPPSLRLACDASAISAQQKQAVAALIARLVHSAVMRPVPLSS